MKQRSNIQQKQTGKRELLRSMIRGFICRCPSCGEASVFERWLLIKTACESCHADLSHHRADDLPAYLNVFIVGHVVVGFMLFVTRYNLMDLWATTFTTAGLSVVVGLLLMRPLKGMVVGSQWALRMHGFGGEEEQVV